MAVPAATTPTTVEDYPGKSLGLPATGPGRLASWMSRITALVLDWAICTGLAVLFLGLPALTAYDWRRWAVLALFFVESAALTAITGASAGQLLTGITVVRLDGQRLGIPRAIARAALVSLAIPALVVGANRRGLHDVAVGTVVVTRR